MTAVYDAGFLVAVDRGDRIALAKHTLRLQRREIAVVTAPVVAQVARSARQARLHRVLRGCDVVGFAPADAAEVGAILAASNTSDVVDAHVVLVSSRLGATVLTSDIDDLERLSAHTAPQVRIEPV